MNTAKNNSFIFQLDDKAIDDCLNTCSPSLYNQLDKLLEDAKAAYMYISEVSGFTIEDLQYLDDQSIINLCRILQSQKKYSCIEEHLRDILAYRRYDDYYLSNRL